MPLYEIGHCASLSKEQKDAIAEFITDLHATTFVTPRLFVNVVFDQPPPKGEIYAGAKSRGQILPNHIRALVRVGPTRPKEKYDEVALKIQRKWYEVVDDGTPATKLHSIVFHPMIAALESGVIVPGPGDEGTWLKDNMAFFQEQAEVHNNEDVKDMLKEIKEREDLRNLIE